MQCSLNVRTAPDREVRGRTGPTPGGGRVTPISHAEEEGYLGVEDNDAPVSLGFHAPTL
jgi:hypothetical protein